MGTARTSLVALALVAGLDAQIAWTQLLPAGGPGTRVAPALAFDEARGVTVLFGGFDGPVTPGDTWTFDGSTWSRVATTGPAPRTGHVLVYDPLRRVVVLFGGSVPNAGIVDDTWEWDGVRWTQRFPATVPPARTLAAGAPWPAWGGIVVHGGYPLDGTPYFWSFDGNDWTDRTTATTPNGADHALAYHPVQRRLLMAGDSLNVQFDGRNWVESDPSLLPHRGARMAYDPGSNHIVMWGGFDYGSLGPTYYDATWAWDGIWSRLDVGPTPGGRSDFGMAFDALHRSLLVYGGIAYGWLSSVEYDDLWALAPAPSPTPYFEARATGFGLTTACQFVGGFPLSVTAKPMLFTAGERAWIGERGVAPGLSEARR
ncbi:MAG: hypothetical protein IPM29_17850 [Planctomycetes bacterium]|nr:hypothetical protein [Planctomycetota bacterium]